MSNDTESEDEISEEILENLELNLSIPSSREENISLKITTFESDSNTPSLNSNAIILTGDEQHNRCQYEPDFQRRNQTLSNTRQSKDEKFSFNFVLSDSSRSESDTSPKKSKLETDIHDINLEEEELSDIDFLENEKILTHTRSDNVVNDIRMYESSHQPSKGNSHQGSTCDDLSQVPSLNLTKDFEDSWSSEGHAKDRSVSELSISIPKVCKISTDAGESVYQLVRNFSLQDETSFENAQNPPLSLQHQATELKSSLSSLEGPLSLQFSAYGPRYRLHSPQHLSKIVYEKANKTYKTTESVHSDKWAYVLQNLPNSNKSNHKKNDLTSKNGTSQESKYKQKTFKDKPNISEAKSCPVSPRQKRSNQNNNKNFLKSCSFQNTNYLSKFSSADSPESSMERDILQSKENKKDIYISRKKTLSKSSGQKENSPTISQEISEVISVPKSLSFSGDKYLDDLCNIAFLKSQNLSQRSSAHTKHSKTGSYLNKSKPSSNRMNININHKRSDLSNKKYKSEEILSACDTDDDLEEMEDLGKSDGNFNGLANVKILDLKVDFSLNSDVISQNLKIASKGKENENLHSNEILEYYNEKDSKISSKDKSQSRSNNLKSYEHRINSVSSSVEKVIDKSHSNVSRSKYTENTTRSSNVNSPKSQSLSIKYPKLLNKNSTKDSLSWSDDLKKINKNSSRGKSLLVTESESNSTQNKEIHLLNRNSPSPVSPKVKIVKQIQSNVQENQPFMHCASLDNSNNRNKSTLLTDYKLKSECQYTFKDSLIRNKEFVMEKPQGILRRQNSGGFDVLDKSEDCECSGICDSGDQEESISIKYRSASASRSHSFSANSTSEELLVIDVDNSGRDILSGDFSDTSEVILGILNKSPISAITERTEESGHDNDIVSAQEIDLDSNLNLKNESDIPYVNNEHLKIDSNKPSNDVGNSWENPCFPSLPGHIPTHISSHFTDPSSLRDESYLQPQTTSEIAHARKTEIKSSSHRVLQKASQGIVGITSKFSKQNNPLKRPDLQRMTSKSLHNLAGSPRSRYRQQDSFHNKTVSISSENLSQRSPRSKCWSPAGDAQRQSRSSTPRLRSHLDRRCVSAFTINEDHYNNGVFNRNQSVSLNRLNRSRSSSMTSITGFRRPDYSHVQSKVRRYIHEMKEKDIRNSTRSLPVTPSKSSRLKKESDMLYNKKLILDLAKASNVEEDFPDEFENLKKQFLGESNDPKSLEQLLKLLILERNSRHKTDKTLSALQLEYENLITKHAAAENLIDQLRFYKDIKINKEYLVKIKGQDASKSSVTTSLQSSRQTTPPNTPNRQLSFTPTLTSFTQLKSSSPIIDAGFSGDPSGSYLFQESVYEDTTRDTSVTDRGSKLCTLNEIKDEKHIFSSNGLSPGLIKDQNLSSSYRRKSCELTIYEDSGVVDETNDMVENWSIESDLVLKKIKDFAILEASKALEESEKKVIWNHILEKYFDLSSMFPGVSLVCGRSQSPGLKLQDMGQAIRLTAERFRMDLNVPKDFSSGRRRSSDYSDRRTPADIDSRVYERNQVRADLNSRYHVERDDSTNKFHTENLIREGNGNRIHVKSQHKPEIDMSAESASQTLADNERIADIEILPGANTYNRSDNEYQHRTDNNMSQPLTVLHVNSTQDKNLYDDNINKMSKNIAKGYAKPKELKNNSKSIQISTGDVFEEEIKNILGNKQHLEIKSKGEISPKESSEIIIPRSSINNAVKCNKGSSNDKLYQNDNKSDNKSHFTTVDNHSLDYFEPANRDLQTKEFDTSNVFNQESSFVNQESSALQNHEDNLVKKDFLESYHNNLKSVEDKDQKKHLVENIQEHPCSPVQSNDSMKTVGVIEKVEMWQMSLPSQDIRVKNDFDDSSGSSTTGVLSLPQTTSKQQKIPSISQHEQYKYHNVEEDSRESLEQRHLKAPMNLVKNQEYSLKTKINTENTQTYPISPCGSGRNTNGNTEKSKSIPCGQEVYSKGSCSVTPRVLWNMNSNKPRDLDSGCPGSERSIKFSRNASIDNHELHTEDMRRSSIHSGSYKQDQSSNPPQIIREDHFYSSNTSRVRQNNKFKSLVDKSEVVCGTKAKCVRTEDVCFDSKESHDSCPNSDIVNVAFGSSSGPIHNNDFPMDRVDSHINRNASPDIGNDVSQKASSSIYTHSNEDYAINDTESHKINSRKRNAKEIKYDTKIKSKYPSEIGYLGNPANYNTMGLTTDVDQMSPHDAYLSDASHNSSFTSDGSKTLRLKKDIEIMKIQMQELSAQVFHEKQKKKKYENVHKAKSLKADKSLKPLKAFDISSSNSESNDSSQVFTNKVRPQKRKGQETRIPSTNKSHRQVYSHDNNWSKYQNDNKEDIISFKTASVDKSDSEYGLSRSESTSIRRKDIKVQKGRMKSNQRYHQHNDESEEEIISQINNHNEDSSVTMDISMSNLSPYNTINMEKLPCSTPVKELYREDYDSEEERKKKNYNHYKKSEIVNSHSSNMKKSTNKTVINSTKETERSLNSCRNREQKHETKFHQNNYSEDEIGDNVYSDHIRMSQNKEDDRVSAHKSNRRNHNSSERKLIQESVRPLRVSKAQQMSLLGNKRDRTNAYDPVDKKSQVTAITASAATAASISSPVSSITAAPRNKERGHPTSPSHFVYIQHYNSCCLDSSVDKRDVMGAENVAASVESDVMNIIKKVNKSSNKNIAAQSSSQTTQCQTNMNKKGRKSKGSCNTVSYRELLATLDEATKMADKIRQRSQNLLEDLNMQVLIPPHDFHQC